MPTWFEAKVNGNSRFEAGTLDKLCENIVDYYADDFSDYFEDRRIPVVESVTRWENDEEIIMGEAAVKKFALDVSAAHAEAMENIAAEQDMVSELSSPEMTGRI